MDYYIIPAKMAEELDLTLMRAGNKENGYIVNASDLAPIGIETAKMKGARYVNAWKAKELIDKINNK